MLRLYIFALSSVLWYPLGAQALSPQIFGGIFQVSFPSNSSILDEAAKEMLAKRLDKLVGRSGLEYVIVIGYSDRESVKSDRPWQLGLATARARAIEKFLVDSGLPQEKVYSEGRIAGGQASYGNTSRQAIAGTAEVEYHGTCNVASTCSSVNRLSD